MIAMVNRAVVEEDEPPLRGKKSKSKPHNSNVSRMFEPTTALQQTFGNYKANVLKETYELPKEARAASVQKTVDRDRLFLNTWHAHVTPRDYNAFIKTRSVIDPELDLVTLEDGSFEFAPERLKSVKIYVKGKRVWKLRPEKTMIPEDWKSKPHCVIKNWSKFGVARARKEYEDREQESRNARLRKGKPESEDLRDQLLISAIVRRPPGMDMDLKRIKNRYVSRAAEWFALNADGQGIFYREPYRNGIVDPKAEADLEEHNLHAELFCTHMRQCALNQISVQENRSDFEEQDETLEAYKQELINREVSYTDDQGMREEGVSEKVQGPMHWLEHTIVNSQRQEGTKAQVKRRVNLITEEKFDPPPFDHNERAFSKEMLTFETEDEDSDVIEGEYEVLSERSVDVSDYAEESVRKMFDTARTYGIQVIKGFPDDGKEAIHIPGGVYNFDYDDARTMAMIRTLVERHEHIVNVLKGKFLVAKISQEGFRTWLSDLNEADAEYNLEGLIDDETVIMEVERIPSAYSVAQYERMKEDFRREEIKRRVRLRELKVKENRRKFFRRAERIIPGLRKKAVVKARMSVMAAEREGRAQERAERQGRIEAKKRQVWKKLLRKRKLERSEAKVARNRKRRDLYSHYMKLLHSPQNQGNPVQWLKEMSKAVNNWLNDLQKESGEEREYRITIEGVQEKSKIVWNGLSGDEAHKLVNELVTFEMIRNDGTVSEPPREKLIEIPEQVDEQPPRQEEIPAVQETEPEQEEIVKVPDEPICAPSGSVYETKKTGIEYIHGGDYNTPLRQLWKEYVLKQGMHSHSSSKDSETQDETVEETGHRDQSVGPGAYKPSDHPIRNRTPKASRKAKRSAKRRSQRQRRAA